MPKSIFNFTKLEEGGRILDWDLRRVIDGKMTCVVSRIVKEAGGKKHNKNNK
jgi:hypothetical protein